MGIIESHWNQIVKSKLPSSKGTALTKAQQQAVAVSLQEWSSVCIRMYLDQILSSEGRTDLNRKVEKVEWQINYKGKDFLGAVRVQEIDVWVTNLKSGLVLAVDPKHFQSSSSLDKNWKNGHNDLVAFSSNIHERFPLCAVGAIISFPEWASSPTTLKQMHSICGRSVPRERTLDSFSKFEGFGIAIYDASSELIWPSSFHQDSHLKPSYAFESLAKALYSRTIALL